MKFHKITMEKTHNLEVTGSSPVWSTIKISNLEEIQVADFSFCENILFQSPLFSHVVSWSFYNAIEYIDERLSREY